MYFQFNFKSPTLAPHIYNSTIKYKIPLTSQEISITMFDAPGTQIFENKRLEIIPKGLFFFSTKNNRQVDAFIILLNWRAFPGQYTNVPLLIERIKTLKQCTNVPIILVGYNTFIFIFSTNKEQGLIP